MVKGIDVSKYQGSIDWKKVKAAGIQFAIIRAGMGNTASQIDPWFKRHMDGALAAGLDVGCYWMNYYRTVDEAKKEAEAFLTVIAPYKGKITYPLASDFEGDSIRYVRQCGYKPTAQTVTAQTVAFLSTLEKAGWYTALYTNRDFYKNWFIRKDLEKYDVWLADWGDNNHGFNVKPYYTCGLHQTTSKGHIDGISGNVDLNLAYKDYPKIIKQQSKNGLKPDTPKPAPQKVDVTYRVKTQKHGWLPWVKDLKDYAGWKNSPIIQIDIKVSSGTIKGRVHTLGGKWSGYKEASSISIGSGKPIDAVELIGMKYRVAVANRTYYSWQYSNTKGHGMDGYAGLIGKAITKLQITKE